MRIGHNSQTIVEALAAITSSLAPIWCHGRLPNKELSHEVVLSPNIMVFLLLSLKLPGCNLSFDNYAFLNLLRLSSVTSNPLILMTDLPVWCSTFSLCFKQLKP
ncbi:hypothetical protein VitviT2T_013529 [Vitis vinifera]|uniref:Uncharacterized protein n=1 Tax=Vitis vinifera TaxID=29760 RepID=A0ABY9CGY9_VITVI|nr:hypothetical protein VitviT2T_013529 [Vitis vinifera]